MKRQPLSFKIGGTVPLEEIPRNEYESPYDPIFRAVAKAPVGEAVKIRCDSVEEATLLKNRLYAASKGSLTIKQPTGSRFVYVGAKAKPKKRKGRK